MQFRFDQVRCRKSVAWLALFCLGFWAAGVKAAEFSALPFPVGQMERFDGDGVPEGWSVPAWGAVAFSKGEGHGRTFLRMTWPHLGYLQPISEVKVHPEWKSLRLTVDVRIEEITLGDEARDGGLMFRASFLDEKGTILSHIDTPVVNQVTDWTTLSMEANVPDRSATLKLVPGFYMASGAVDLDNVTLLATWKGDVPDPVPAVELVTPGDQPQGADAGEAPGPQAASRPDRGLRKGINRVHAMPVLPLDDWDRAPIESLTDKRSRIVLSGMWRFLPASEQEGTWGSIRVPGSWKQSSLPGIEERGEGQAWSVNIDQMSGGWYSRIVDIPAEWDGQAILLELTRVSTDATVFVDGQEAGSIGLHHGSPAFGTVDLTSVVRPGRANRIDILVTADTSETEYIQMMGVSEGQQVRRRRAIPFAGLIGDAILTTRPQGGHISDVFVQTSTREQKVTLDIELTEVQAAGTVTVVAEMLDEQGHVEKVFSAAAEVGSGDAQKVQVSHSWPDPRLWDFQQPNLYTLRLSVKGPGIDDTFAQTFGFREFWIDGREFYLNNTPFRLRQIFRRDHAGYPALIDSQLQADIDLGFNCLQLWPEDPYAVGNFQDVVAARADRMGMPVMGITVPLQRVAESWDDPEFRDEFLRLYRRDMRRLRNHPSIILWGSSGNYFGHEQDQNPRLLGRQDWIPEREQVAWQWGSRPVTRRILEAMRPDDPTRPFYMHAGTHIADFPTSNTYFNFIPLQEREEWMSEWAKTGTHPWWAVEFGLPLEYSFLRSRRDPVYSERLFTEHVATMKGSEAFLAEPEGYREFHRAYYRGTDDAKLKAHDIPASFWPENAWLHSHWNIPSRYDARLSPAYEDFMTLHIRNTYRSWRTQGLTSTPMPWAFGRGRLLYDGDETDTVRLPDFEPGQRGAWQASLPQKQFFSVPGKSVTLDPIARALKDANSATLAWIAGPAEVFTAKDHAFWNDEVVHKSMALLNDTRTPQDFAFEWVVEIDGEVVDNGQVDGKLSVGETRLLPIEIALERHSLARKTDATIILRGTIGDHSHEDAFPLRVFPRPEEQIALTVSLYDPVGKTRQMLEQIGATVQDWDGTPTDNLVVIGREALKSSPPASLEQFVLDGGRVLVMAQPPDWTESTLALRVARHMSRRVFPVDDSHPVLSGLDELDLRDWRGESTLVEPYPDYGTERQLPAYGWKWGNRGGLTSGAIEKPHHAGWRPILEAEFDLAYTPLMELDYGHGRMIWSSIDLEDYVGHDPVATLLAQQLLRYAADAPLPDWNRQTVLLSNGQGKKFLDGIGLNYELAEGLPADGGLAVIAADVEIPDAELQAFLSRGGRVLFLAREMENAPLGVVLEKNESVGRSEPLPQWPELRGISMSDTRTRAPISTWVVVDGAETAADGLIGRIEYGEGVAVICQISPDALDTENEPYLRFTRWRQTRTVVQLLANLGASHRLDSYIPQVRSAADRIPLAGTWRVRSFDMRPCAADVQNIPPIPPISYEAKASVAPDVSEDRWQPAEVPGMWPGFDMTVGEAVFRRVVHVPDDWAGRDLKLSLGALDDADITFWNGEQVGEGAGWNKPRSYVVPGRLVKPGDNVLAIRIYNNYRDGGFNAVAAEIHARPAGGDDQSDTGYYHPDYRSDREFGDSPYRYHRW
jgi:beta-galactosidase